MKPQRTIAACAVMLAGVPVFATSQIPIPKPLQITEIVLENQPGFVAPPFKVYKVVLRADGKAYRLTGPSDKMQKMTATLSPEVFARLTNLLNSQKFFEMKDRYTPEPMATDGPSVFVTATRGGQNKSVDDYMNGAPVGLWGIEMAIRGVASELDWKPLAKPAPHRIVPEKKKGFTFLKEAK